MGLAIFALGLVVVMKKTDRCLLPLLMLGWLWRCYSFYGNYFRCDLDSTVTARVSISHFFKHYALLGCLVLVLIGGKIFPTSQKIQFLGRPMLEGPATVDMQLRLKAQELRVNELPRALGYE